MRLNRADSPWVERQAVSDVIATLILIAIAVVAAVLIYALVNGLFSNFQTGGPSSLVTASGQMTVPGSTAPFGVITLNLRNEGSQPISNVLVACSNPPFSSANCDGIKLNYQGMPVAPGNILPVNALASGSMLVNSASTFTAGTSYQLTMTIDFVGGANQIVLVSVPSSS